MFAFRANPQRLQQMLQTTAMFRESGSLFAHPFGALGGAGAARGFPAPGVPSELVVGVGNGHPRAW